MPELRRKAIRLPQPYYLGYRAYFVTICAKERKRLFVSGAIVDSLLEVLREEAARFRFEVYAYCFMPDHCHFLLEGRTEDANLSEMIRGFKGCSAANLRRTGIREAWQKGFYEHILRTGDDHAAVAAYIFENPIRAGLAKEIYEWPFSGSFVFDLRKFQPPSVAFTPLHKTTGLVS